MNRYWNQLRAVGVMLAMCAGAGNAFAGGYCSDTTPCKAPTDTCNGYYCVPTAKLCTADSACAAWERCDFGCPSGIGGGGGTTTTGGGPTSSADASSGSTGTGTGYADAGSSGGSWVDASSVPPPWDAGAGDDPFYPDGISYGDAMPIDPGFDGGIYESKCPASPGVCVPVMSKVPAQDGCDAFCKALVPCNLSFGSGGSGSSSGGSSGSGGGGTPTPSADAGSTEPFAPDAGFGGGPEPLDASPSYDTNMPMIDDAGPAPDAQAECVAMCSVWKLDQAAPAELAALEACVAGVGTDCKAIESTCEAAAKTFIDAATLNDAWSLGMGGYSTAAGSEGGGTKGGDGNGTPTSWSDAGSSGGLGASDATPPQGATSNDSAATSNTASSSGCTAGTGNTQASGLGLMGSIGALAIVLRRRSMA